VGILGAAAVLLAAAAPSSPLALGVPLAWRRIAEGEHGEPVSALALEEGAPGLRLAVGDARGVRLFEAPGRSQRLLHRGPVRDLAFLPRSLDAEGGLLAATGAGLYRIGATRSWLVDPAPGAQGRSVHRIAVSAGAVAVATDAGAFLSSDGAAWQRLSTRLPREPATAAALRDTPAGLECYVVIGGRLWRVELVSGAAGWQPTGAARETLPFAKSGDGPVDVVFEAAASDTVIVFPSAFARRASHTEPWQPVQPSLPPGARARRLHAAHGTLWLATDRGLLVADALEGPWRRATRPAGTADVSAVASDPSELYVAAGERVLATRPMALTGASSREASLVRGVSAGGRTPPAASLAGVGSGAAGAFRLRTPEGDPPIEQVHRAALHYLDLRSSRMAALRRGVGARGWLPLVSLRLARARDVDESTDFDETFTSGSLHRLVDREARTARDFEASLTFAWDLGDIAYHPEQIDVSREAREVIKLRDDVLDEVTQLYFERRRVVAELAVRPDAPEEEKLRLRLRAAELAAGLDAWTGGWFQRARTGHP